MSDEKWQTLRSQDISGRNSRGGTSRNLAKFRDVHACFGNSRPEKFGRSCHEKLPHGKLAQKFQIRNVDGKLSPDPDMSPNFGEHFRQIPTCYTKFRRTLSPDPDMSQNPGQDPGGPPHPEFRPGGVPGPESRPRGGTPPGIGIPEFRTFPCRICKSGTKFRLGFRVHISVRKCVTGIFVDNFRQSLQNLLRKFAIRKFRVAKFCDMS